MISFKFNSCENLIHVLDWMYFIIALIVYMLDIILKTFVPELNELNAEQRQEVLKTKTPFFSGFGNRITDDISMAQLGIALERSKYDV